MVLRVRLPGGGNVSGVVLSVQNRQAKMREQSRCGEGKGVQAHSSTNCVCMFIFVFIYAWVVTCMPLGMCACAHAPVICCQHFTTCARAGWVGKQSLRGRSHLLCHGAPQMEPKVAHMPGKCYFTKVHSKSIFTFVFIFILRLGLDKWLSLALNF